MTLESFLWGAGHRSSPAVPPRRARSRRWLLALALGAGALFATPAAGPALQAQEPADAEPRRWATRAELERQAAQLEAAAATGRGTNETRAEAVAIRTRLREGDFPAGTPIVVSPTSTVGIPPELLEAFKDTLRVREGSVLQLPGVPDLSLRGVLRAELQEALVTHLGRTIRNPAVRAGTLIPVQVAGPTNRPGFYTVPSDMLITELVMHAGGPAGNADVNRSVVKRGNQEIVGADSLQAAMRAGATLDQIGFQSGDALVVAEKRERPWRTIITVVGAVSSVAYLLLRLSDR